MKTIGLIGGMSWESSLLYYQIINQRVKEKLGGHHSAKSLMYSVDFHEIKTLQHAGKWEEATQMLVKEGAEAVILGCTEITLLISQQDTSVPLFDTTKIHAEYAVDFALGEYNEVGL